MDGNTTIGGPRDASSQLGQESSACIDGQIAVPRPPHSVDDSYVPSPSTSHSRYHSIRPYASDDAGLHDQSLAHHGTLQEEENPLFLGPPSPFPHQAWSHDRPVLPQSAIPPRRHSLAQGGGPQWGPSQPRAPSQPPGYIGPEFNPIQASGSFSQTRVTDGLERNRINRPRIPTGPRDQRPISPAKPRMHARELSGEAKPFTPQGPIPPRRQSSKARIPSASTAPFKSSHKNSSPMFHQFQPHFTPPESYFSYQGEVNGGLSQGLFDSYVSPTPPLAAVSQGSHQPQVNPYAQDSTTAGGASYYQNSAYTQPVQYHLYASLGPYRETLLPYQRTAHDFFISDALREDLQRKSAATLQILPSGYTYSLGLE